MSLKQQAYLYQITLIPRISTVLGLSCDILLKGKEERSIHYEQVGITVDTADIMLQNDIDSLFGFCKREEKADYRIVLHADDSDFLRSMVKNIISSQGYDVIEAKGFVAKPFSEADLLEHLYSI